jgi:hypothetical protein
MIYTAGFISTMLVATAFSLNADGQLVADGLGAVPLIAASRLPGTEVYFLPQSQFADNFLLPLSCSMSSEATLDCNLYDLNALQVCPYSSVLLIYGAIPNDECSTITLTITPVSFIGFHITASGNGSTLDGQYASVDLADKSESFPVNCCYIA